MAKDVKIRITAKDETKPAISSTTKGLKTLGNVAKLTGRVIGRTLKMVRNLGLAGVAAMVGLTKHANSFRKSMAEVNTIIDGGGIAKFTEQVIDLSAELGVAKNELAKGLYQTLSAGVPKDNAIEFLTTATKAAIGGVTNTETAVTALTKVMDSYGLSAKDASHISDIMFTTVKKGVINFEQLSMGIGQVAGIAGQAGVDFEDLMGIIATGSKTVNPRQLFTGLRASIVAITTPTDDLRKVFDELGKTGEEMIRDNGITGALNAISDATGGSLEKMKKLIPSVEALPVILAVTGKNTAKVTKNIEAMKNAANAAKDAFDKMEGVKAWDRLFQQILKPITKLGIVFDKELSPAAEKIGEAIEKWQASESFMRFIENAKTSLQEIAQIITDFSAGGDAKAAATKLAKTRGRQLVEGAALGVSKSINPFHEQATGFGSSVARAQGGSVGDIARVTAAVYTVGLSESLIALGDKIVRAVQKGTDATKDIPAK